MISKFKGKSWISTIDIKSGYWHVPIRKADRCKTAFIFNGQVYEWNVMPFGPTNAPPHFQKVMDGIFSDLDYVMVYMDDITIVSSNPKQHQQHLQEVFNRLAKYKIKIRPDKCKFAQESVEYLGFRVCGTGIKIKSTYKDKIINIPVPKTINQLRRFVGMVQYLHQFIPNLQWKLKPFHQLTEKDRKFKWNDTLDKIFQSIKNEIFNTQMIHHPDPNRPFSVYCDASKDGVGAVLVQAHDGKHRPVSFCSKLFNRTQQNWHVSEQEIYAVIHAVEKWRSYLIGNHFTVYTDHQNLQELFNRAKNFRAGKLYRWAVRLQEFEFTAKYIAGHKNKMADYMSRDALYHQHTNETNNIQTDNKPNNKPTPILQLYLHHLYSSTNNPYFTTSDHILYTMQPKNNHTILDDDNNIPINTPINHPINSLNLPDLNKTINTTTNSTKSSSTHSHTNSNFSSKPIPNPIFKPPSHSYPTRYAQSQRANIKFQTNLRKPLHLIPDPNLTIPFNKNSISPPSNAITTTNHNIITQKHSYPAYNRNLLQPTTPSTPQIQDTHDINSYISSIPVSILRYHQSMDSFLYPLIQYLKHHNNYYLQDLPDYQYNYLLTGRYYINQQGLLMYRYGTLNNIVIPAILKRSVLQWAHGLVHHGGGKLLLRITETARYWWIGLRKDIKSYLETCDSCQRLEKGRRIAMKSGNIKTFSKTKAFELVSIDICGPLPQTESGNRYIVSMIDKFTRFCYLVPVKDIRTLTIVKAYQKWINLFGAPKCLLSDNGTQFTSEIFKCFTQQHKTKQVFSTPYYPESNGQVERLHRWIKERLSLISIDGGMNFIDGDDNWDDYIGIIQHAYNSTPNTITKYSPNKIVFGYDLTQNINPSNQSISKTSSTNEYLEYMNNNRMIINNEAISNQSNYDKIRSKSYNKSRLESHKYEVGDLILVDVSRRTHGNKNKFTPTWHGPHEIIHIISPEKVFKIREVGNIQHIQHVNIRFIKPYNASPYMMMINWIGENPQQQSKNITQYIKQRQLNKCLIKLTPSSKKRQMLYFTY